MDVEHLAQLLSVEIQARVLVMGDEVQTEENFFRRTITINRVENHLACTWLG